MIPLGINNWLRALVCSRIVFYLTHFVYFCIQHKHNDNVLCYITNKMNFSCKNLTFYSCLFIIIHLNLAWPILALVSQYLILSHDSLSTFFM